jgi:hypothetical protein
MGGPTTRFPPGDPVSPAGRLEARGSLSLARAARRTPATSVAQARTPYELASVFRLAVSGADVHGMAAVLTKAWSSLGVSDRAHLLEYAEGALRDAQVAGTLWIDDAMAALDGRIPRECGGALSAHIAYSQQYGALAHSEEHTLARIAGRDAASPELEAATMAAAIEWGRLVGAVALPELPPAGQALDVRLYDRPQVRDLVSRAAATAATEPGARAFFVAALTAAAGGNPEDDRDAVRARVIELVRRWPTPTAT